MSTDTDFERILRADLHAAADDLVVPLTVDQVLDAAARARTRQRLLRVGLVVLAVLIAGLLWWATGLGAPGNRAVPDPLQRPTAPAPTASGSATSATPSAAVTPEATLSLMPSDDDRRPGEPPSIRASLGAGGRTVDFVGLGDSGPVGAVRSVVLGEGDAAVLSNEFTSPGYVIGVVRGEAAWIEPVQPGAMADWGITDHTIEVLPGTGLSAFAVRYRDVADASSLPELVWADAQGRVRDGEGRTLASATFGGSDGAQRVFFSDARLGVAGVDAPSGRQLVRYRPDAIAQLSVVSTDIDERRYLIGGVVPVGTSGASLWFSSAEVEESVPLELAEPEWGALDGRLFYTEWVEPQKPDASVSAVTFQYGDASGVAHKVVVWP